MCSSSARCSEIERLTSGHAFGTTGMTKYAQHLHAVRVVAAREDFERKRLQRVAGKHRHGFAEHDMAGGATTPQCVVIHCRQIVVHQRIGMDQLDRAGWCIQLGTVVTQCMAGSVGKQRTQAFAAAKCGVAHGAVQCDGRKIFRWQQIGQRAFGAGNQGSQRGAWLRLRA
jgi:hypothetical protein